MAGSVRRGLRFGLAAAALFAAAPVLAGAGPVAWLQKYLSFDTSNPPGGELPAIRYLASLIERGDPGGEIEVRVLLSPNGRANLYARLPANAVDATARSLVLLHHLDVVPAGEGWTRPPFGGELHRGRIWGRGALDAKSLGVAHLNAMLDLLGSDPRGAATWSLSPARTRKRAAKTASPGCSKSTASCSATPRRC